MKKIIGDLIEAAKEAGAEVKVVEITMDDPADNEVENAEPIEEDAFPGAKEHAEAIAKLNKILYEAHINEGFAGKEALALTIASIERF